MRSAECTLHRSQIILFFNDTATTEIYTLSLRDALPISSPRQRLTPVPFLSAMRLFQGPSSRSFSPSREWRSEEHTSELQSRQYLVCRLLLEKKTNSASIQKTTSPLVLFVQQ